MDLEEHLSGKTDVDVYRQLLAEFKIQGTKAKDITDTVTVGVFKLDFSLLKQRVLPAISRCIEQLYQVLPRIARKRMDSILKENQRYFLEIIVSHT
jgi:dynein heavy chain